VQVAGHLRGALPGADHDDPARVAQAGEPVEQLLAVPDPLVAHHPLRQDRFEPGREDQVTGAPGGQRAVTLADDHVQILDRPGHRHRGDRDDLGAVLHLVGEGGGRPFEVVVELPPGGEHRLVVDEVDQAPFGLQIGEKAELARRIPHGDQILEEGHLHRGPFQQHAPVPAEGGLFVEEHGVCQLARPRVVLA
jgi:hypothetical protein